MVEIKWAQSSKKLDQGYETTHKGEHYTIKCLYIIYYYNFPSSHRRYGMFERPYLQFHYN